MNAVLDTLLGRERLVATLVALLVVVGLASWISMPRQEDPSFVERFATVVVPFPGADAERVEQLVLRPVEEALAEVDALQPLESTARTGFAVVQLRLEDDIYDTPAAWDEVRDALDEAAPELPDRAGPLALDTEVGDPAAVVLLVTGSDDLLTLRDAARTLQERLLRVDGVSRVAWLADPGARMAVRLDPALSERLGLDARSLAAQLQAHNVTLPAGSLRTDGRQLILRPEGELLDLAELRATPIVVGQGTTIPLGELATVELEPATPATARVMHDGQPAVGLTVVPVRPQNLVAFGDRIQVAIDDAVVELQPLRVETFAFQPTQVADRLAGLSRSLMLGVLIVGGVLLAAMGSRLGLVVAAVVPLVTLSTVALYAMGGGVLHQISIAALVLALGLLVDNAIVVAEAVQQNLDAGVAPRDAAARAIRELALPLGAATGTTLAAFTPMLLSTGGTADFTRSIPVVLMIALVLSYVFALAVTPALSARVLRPALDRGPGRLDALAAWIARVPVAHPVRTLVGLVTVLALTVGLSTQVDRSFFPLSDRSRMVVGVTLPEGSHLSTTEAVVAALSADIEQLDGVTTTTAFIGRGPPRFYYNLNDVPAAPHAATLVATVAHRDDLPATVEAVRGLARRHPDAVIVPKRLQQGPPVGAPIEVRVTARELDDLATVVDQVTAVLRDVPGTRDVRSDLGVGVPTLAWDLDDAQVARHRLGRGDVALSLLSRTRGVPAGRWQHGWEPVDIEVTGPDGEATPLSQLLMTDVARPGAAGVPLGQLGTPRVAWAPAAVHHHDRQRTAVVQAELADGQGFGGVVAAAGPHLDRLSLPAGAALTWGGEAEGSAEANQALLRTVPVGIGLLLFFLLVEFNSFRRVAIVLVTVPLAAAGVVPGLALAGQPFGFMSMLGVTSLVGIVVNNAIVLLEVVEQERREGAGVDEALGKAVRARLRPILLTTATTVSGMLPLAFSSSSLWPPLAWAMISGLVASTGLTLVAVPALYRLMFPDEVARPWRWALPAALLALAPTAGAAPLTLGDALDLAGTAPVVVAESAEARAARSDATAAWLGAVGPTVGLQSTATWRDDPVQIDTPFGPIPQQPDQQVDAGAEVTVPLVDAAAWLGAPAAGRAADARSLAATRTAQLARLQAGEAFLDVVALTAQAEANDEYVTSLRAVAERARARSDAQLALPADALRAEVALADAVQLGLALQRQREVASYHLGRTLGLAEPVEPAFRFEVPQVDEASVAAADLTRPDLAALDASIAALGLQRASLWAEALPTAEAFGAWRWSDNEALVDAQWLEGGVRLRWAPVAKGTRLARGQGLRHRRHAAEARREALRLTVGVETRSAQAGLAVATSEIDVRTQALAQAIEASALVQARYGEGLATLTDWLQVEADVRRQRTRLRVAEVEVVRAGLRLDAAVGAGG